MADDGRYWLATTDTRGDQWWSSYTLWYDTQDPATRELINVQGVSDDGRSWTTTYDVNELYDWSEQTVWYGHDGSIDLVVTV